LKCNTKNCNFEQFENEDHCIFHCNKTIDNGWITSSNDKYIKYNNKIELFWKTFTQSYQHGGMFTIGFIIPFYHTNLVKTDGLSDIKKIKDLDFRDCTFVDVFELIGEDNDIKLKKLAFNNCSFNDTLYLYDLDIEYLSLLHIKLKKTCTLNHLDLNSGEIMDISSIDNKSTTFSISSVNVLEKLELWKSKDENISLQINSGKFNELELNELTIKNIHFEHSKLSKLKITKSSLDILHLFQVDFKSDSKILFEHIEVDNFTLKNISQDSKYIQFNHINISKKLDIDKTEFRNTYFNDFNLSNANVNINKVSFMNSHLNSIEWGNISRIKAGRDIFRELKYIYDEHANYIEANNFFTMEMESYKKELDNKSFFSNYWQEKLVFLLNKKISNFSQSWFLPLLWIFITNLSFFIFIKISLNNYNHMELLVSIMTVISSLIFGRIVYEKAKKNNSIKSSFYTFQHISIIFAFILIINMFNYGSIKDIMWFSNIQSYKDYAEAFTPTSKDILKYTSVYLAWWSHKILTGFFIYHFIIALRRQTKR